MSQSRNRASGFGRGPVFPTTCWTVLGDEERREAVRAELYQQYWDPLYCYARRRGFTRDDATDFTQGFLTEILLGREFLAKADRKRGRFRSLLVKSFQNYIGNILRKKKISPGPEGDVSEYPVAEMIPQDPAAAFDYVWATKMLDGVLADLQAECQRDGLHPHWEIFEEKVMKPVLGGTAAPALEEICRRHAIRSEAQGSNMIVTIKRRFRRILVQHLTAQAGAPAETQEALDDFLGIFSGS